MRVRETARTAVTASLDRAVAAVTRRGTSTREGYRDAELIVASMLSDRTRPLNDPAGYVRFLRECFGDGHWRTSEIHNDGGPADAASVSFDSLVMLLRAGVLVVPEADA